ESRFPADVVPHPFDDGVERRSWCEDPGDPGRPEAREIGVRDDAADEDGDVSGIALRELGDHGWTERVVSAAHDREADGIDVFLNGGRGNHLGRLMKTRVDDF